jgi:hypothetical protein
MVAASAASADFSRYSKPPPLGGGAFTRQEATRGTERVHHGVEVMRVLDVEMLVDGLDASRALAVADRWHSQPPLRFASRYLGLKGAMTTETL